MVHVDPRESLASPDGPVNKEHLENPAFMGSLDYLVRLVPFRISANGLQSNVRCLEPPEKKDPLTSSICKPQ